MTKALKSKWCPEAGAFALDGAVYIEKLDGSHDCGPCVNWDGARCRTRLVNTCKGDEPNIMTEEKR